MEDRKRTLFAVIIACVVVLAVLYSFGLNLFASRPQLELADPNATAGQNHGGKDPGNQGGIPVEITTNTVQRVVADLARYTSYSRTVTVTYYWGEGGVGSASAQVWANDGWVRTDAGLPSGTAEHSIVGENQLWLWYDDGTRVYHGSAREMTEDLMQRIPTYEDVLALDVSDITAADYMDYDGQPCIYMEARQSDLGYLYRFWISVDSGLLIASETVSEGKVVYSMTSRELVSPLANAEEYFVLPDGTNLFNLHRAQEGA